MNYEQLFTTATGQPGPYDYQKRLACGAQGDDVAEADWLAAGAACQSQLINIPTGLGKTAAVVLAWLWNRVAHLDPAHRATWPRRLVYCLPMRTLVEQTESEIRKWVGAHGWVWDDQPESRQGKIGIHVLMGGEDAGEWDIYPEENAILIGTQDMLLSRALNRGYGMSRYRWPMHFGLLNNDCLWVMDETQLMGVGVETSAQLDGFRQVGKLPIFGVCPTWWMSATLEASRLATVDHPNPLPGWPEEKLSEKELTSGRPHELVTAPKKLLCSPIKLNSTTKDDYARKLAEFVIKQHQEHTLTLVVVNRVARAREVFTALVGGRQPLCDRNKVALVHSRFRPVDRTRHTSKLFAEGDRIVIATQAIEAGVDVSARLLVTELAPWSSLVQRIGRCNRRADIQDATVFWIDIEPKDEGDDTLSRPYANTELRKARAELLKLTDASPLVLKGGAVPPEPCIRPVIRRRDLVDLFDTTPDLCGQDLDISRYIRDGDDNDVQFFWREIVADFPEANEPQPHRDELCRVAIGDAGKFLKSDKTRAWAWNPLEKAWQPVKVPRPGAVYLVDKASGGYEDDLGWTGEVKVKNLTIHRPTDGEGESYGENRNSIAPQPQTLAEHTLQVVRQASTILASLTPLSSFADSILKAAQWHDVGKAHAEFQKMLCEGDQTMTGIIWAKSAHPFGKCGRAGLRHELASALAWLLTDSPHAPGPPGASERDLVAYLIAAHHGKVRLSIRSLPNERGDDQHLDRLFARGIWHGETLPPVTLHDFDIPAVVLDLSFMRMGDGPFGPSWLARAVGLRERSDLGIFRLAYLETLLRSADAQASKKTP